ncbi:12334_t:CDS:2, partial [Cetraspora pellucida]
LNIGVLVSVMVGDDGIDRGDHEAIENFVAELAGMLKWPVVNDKESELGRFSDESICL